MEKVSLHHHGPAARGGQVANRKRNPDPAAPSAQADEPAPPRHTGGESGEDALGLAREMIEVLPVPVFFKGRDGHYLGVNKAWETFFGVARHEFLGKEVHQLYPQSPAVADKHFAMEIG